MRRSHWVFIKPRKLGWSGDQEDHQHKLSVFKGWKERLLSLRSVLGKLTEQFICATATNISSCKKLQEGVGRTLWKIGLQTNPSLSNGQDYGSGCEWRLLHRIIGERPKQRAKAPNPSDYKNVFYPINQACLGQIKKKNKKTSQLSDISKSNWWKGHLHMKTLFSPHFPARLGSALLCKSIDNKKLLVLNTEEDVKEWVETLVRHATNCALIKPYINLHHCVLALLMPSPPALQSDLWQFFSDITPHIWHARLGTESQTARHRPKASFVEVQRSALKTRHCGNEILLLWTNSKLRFFSRRRELCHQK